MDARWFAVPAAAIAAPLLLFASSASAAVVLEFTPASARVGERVGGHSDESGGFLPDDADLEVFLAPSHRIADRASSPRDPRLTRFGSLRVDDEGIGRFTGRVPRLHPGDYVAVGHCRSCIPGGSTFTVGEFTIEAAQLPVTARPVAGVALAGLVLLLAGSMTVRASIN